MLGEIELASYATTRADLNIAINDKYYIKIWYSKDFYKTYIYDTRDWAKKCDCEFSSIINSTTLLSNYLRYTFGDYLIGDLYGINPEIFKADDLSIELNKYFTILQKEKINQLIATSRDELNKDYLKDANIFRGYYKGIFRDAIKSQLVLDNNTSERLQLSINQVVEDIWNDYQFSITRGE